MKFAQLAMAFLLLLLPCAAFAQTTNASITGIIEDPAKAVVPKCLRYSDQHEDRREKHYKDK
jgi:hypothetical protein